VRSILVGRQRAWVDEKGGSAVVEGRDIGSVVFPEADVKVYLDARPEIRAQRRSTQRGADADEVAEAMSTRDQFDSTRAASPLSVPDGAVIVDTSDMTLEAVVSRLMALVADVS
jgi:cytidylate kinase